MKILATSRPIPEITDLFDRMNSNKLEIRAETSDVKKYIEGHMELIPNVARRDAALKEKIKADISETVDGMFLLAEIYLTLLQDKMTVNGVRKQLATFKSQPKDRHDDQKAKTLANAYGQAMNRVNSQKEGLRNLAMGALAWITFSKREITTPELQHALATLYGMHTLNHDDLPDLKDIGSVCIGLITVDERRGIIRLVHYTAQQYLEQTRDHWFPDADEMISKCCITYLSFEDFKSGVCETDTEYAERNKSFPLLNYAASYWGHHISEELESVPAVIGFLRSQTQVEASIQAQFFGKNPFYLDATPPSTVSGLHVAAMFGMVEATRTLLELGCSPNVEGSYNHTPLLWASYYGHETVARLLLDEGAFETEDWVDGRTPLMWAVEMGHTAVVKLLLEKGSEVNLQDHCSQTPLSLATEKGFKTIVELLLEAGAVYEVNDSEYERIPLMQAIKKGDEATVKVLLTRRSKVNFHDAFGKTPLFLAAEKGHKSIVWLLLNAGADLEAKNTTNQRTPLAAAIMHRQKGVVDILLRKGASLHTRDTFDQTPLFIAVGLGNRAIIRQLLDRGADVNARNCDGETPLFFAAALGHVEAIELLHTKGARCNETNHEGKTPLFFAAAVAQSAAIKALVDRGADINARDIQGRTALFSAVESGDEAVVKMMLDMDRIDISGSDAMGLTPISLARICAHNKGNGGGILQLLLQKGNIRGLGFGG